MTKKFKLGEIERKKGFWLEYLSICKKYGFYIGGCGCCNSPFLCEVGFWKDTPIEEEISYFDDNQVDLDICLQETVKARVEK